MNAGAARRPIHVLLVEDNPGDVRLIMEILKEGRARSTFSVARDGEEALSLLQREGVYATAPRPDLIVLDLNLPRKDGRELLGEIKQDSSLRSIPVLILTTSSAEQDVKRAYDLQASCYIIKPVGLERFMDIVSAIENFWLKVATLPPAD